MARYRPKHTPLEKNIVISMSVNALIQLVLDIIFEALHLIPTRINHLSLTTLNAFISFKSLSAIHKNRFSFLHEDCQILWLMELFLIIGDVYYAIFDDFSFHFIYVRLVFILCSLYNFICVTYIMCKYRLWSLTYKGSHSPSHSTAVEIVRRSFRLSRNIEDAAVQIELPVSTKNENQNEIPDDELADDESMDVTDEDVRDEGEYEAGTSIYDRNSSNLGSPKRRSIPAHDDETDGQLIEVRTGMRSSTALLTSFDADV